MAHQVFHVTDLAFLLSHLEQSALGTRLTDANLGAGKALRPAAAFLPSIAQAKIGEGPRAFEGDEYPNQANERIALKDTRISLSFRTIDSFLMGWLAGFALASVSTLQEGATTHYTHTIRPRSPLGTAGRSARLTTLYFEELGGGASRRKGAYADLAVLSFTLTVRPGDFIAVAVDLIGSGREDITAAPTLPALTAVQEFDSQQAKLEIGNQGAALTDLTERLRELVLTVTQQIDEAGRYRPVGGTLANARFAARMPHLRRSAQLSLSFDADRANRDIEDRVQNETRTEIKLTVDSGVLAGTGSVNHKFAFRVPDCRLREARLDFDDSGAFYRIAVPPDQMYRDAGIGSVPFEFVVDNTQASYFA